jgi:hypothetical protein
MRFMKPCWSSWNDNFLISDSNDYKINIRYDYCNKEMNFDMSKILIISSSSRLLILTKRGRKSEIITGSDSS